MKTKCIACDGYGTRPHRSKPGKVVRCRVCSGLGYELSLNPFVPTVPWIEPVPFVPTTPWTDPIQPFNPNPIGPWFMPQTYCGIQTVGGPGGSGGCC